MSIVLFLGAGASVGFDIPLFTRLAVEFAKSHPNRKQRIAAINQELRNVGFSLDIENYISYSRGQLRPKETLLKMNPFVSYFVFNARKSRLGFDKSAAKFIDEIEDYIYTNLFVSQQEKMQKILSHYDSFFTFLNSKYYNKTDLKDFDVDVFTTNYDNVLEEYCEEKGLNFGDGYEPNPDGFIYFDPKLYETHKIRLHKLHGSVRLAIVEEENTKINRIANSKRMNKIGAHYKENWITTERIMILGHEKSIAKEPYFEYLKLLKDKLEKTGVCITVGYSFKNEHILDIFRDVVKARGPEFQLIILDRNASNIYQEKFASSNRIRPVDGDFGDFRRI